MGHICYCQLGSQWTAVNTWRAGQHLVMRPSWAVQGSHWWSLLRHFVSKQRDLVVAAWKQC